MNALVPVDHALDGEVIPPSDERPFAISPAEEQALAEPVKAAHAELVQGMRTTVDKAVVVGRMLLEAKPRFNGTRRWLYWLEHYTPIKRRMAAHYVTLAAARAEMDSRNWKRISNLGIAGAVAELRRRRRQRRQAEVGDDSSPRAAASPATRLRHPCTDSMVDSLIRSLRVYVESYDDLSVEDIHVALDDVANLVRRGALSDGEAGR